jgi:hypothetical protein
MTTAAEAMTEINLTIVHKQMVTTKMERNTVGIKKIHMYIMRFQLLYLFTYFGLIP